MEHNVGPVLEYAPLGSLRAARRLLWIAAIFDLAASACVAVANFQDLWSVRGGTTVRTMEPFYDILGLLLLVLCTMLTLTAGRLGWGDKRTRIITVVVLCLGLMPMVVGHAVVQWIVAAHGLTVGD